MSTCKNCGEKNPPNKAQTGRKRIYCSKACSNEYYKKTKRYSTAPEGYGEQSRKAKEEKLKRKQDYEATIAAGWVNYLDLAEEYGYDRSRLHHRIRAILNENDSKPIHDGTPGANGWKRYISPEGVRKLAEYDRALKKEREAIEIRKLEAQRKREARQKRIEENKKKREAERERKRLIGEQEAKVRAEARAKAKAEEKERKRLIREEKKRQTKLRYEAYIKSPEYRAERAAYRRRRRQADGTRRLRSSITCLVRFALKKQGATKGGKTFAHLDYTPRELYEHIEAQFDENMTWENYGSYWHLDHIIPQAALPYDSLKHPNFKKAWAIDNLQPLEKSENIQKSSLYNGKKFSYDD
jgi:5-methylcytosine-specific restriction endonuclease McrA